MNRESKVVHRGGIHPASDDMPKIPNTQIRNGTYYYYARNRKDLVEAGLVGSHTKVSLKTKDYQVAKERAAKELVAHNLKMDEIAKFNAISELDDNRLKLIQSKRELRDLVLEYFIEMEREHESLSHRYSNTLDSEERDELRQVILEDAAMYGRANEQTFQWRKSLIKRLHLKGFEVNESVDLEDAIILYRKAAQESYRRLVERITGKNYLVRDIYFDNVTVEDEQGTEGKEMTLKHAIKDLCAIYPNRKSKGKLKAATIASYDMPFRVLNEFFSPDTCLKSLGFKDGEKLIDFLGRVPVNSKKRYPNLSLKEAAAREEKSNDPKYCSASRQKSIFVSIKGMLSHAVDIGWIDKNPFGGSALLDKLPEVEAKKREKFTPEELRSIFNCDKYISECPSIEEIGKSNTRGGYFWLPILSLFHGARQNECASLLVSDIKVEAGIHYIRISETDDHGKRVKSLKTKVSERNVPIHKELIKLGFLTYVETRKKQDPEGFLFPEMTPNKVTGNRAKKFSQWFGRLRDTALKNELSEKGRKNFHSFRHAVTDQLRQVTVSDEMRYALLGWTEGSSKKNAGYNYGDGFALEDLKKVIDKVEADVDLSHLYP